MPTESPPGEPPTFSVSELNAAIADALAASFPGRVWVRGEVSNLTTSRNGHTYFELVEKDERHDRVRSVLRVVLFRGDRPAVSRALRDVPGVRLTDGVEVRVAGRVDYYAAGGRLQLVMSAIDPVFTVGLLAAGRERLLRALADEGLLRRNASLELPWVPLRVGLVTSVGSAAYHDFLHELEASGYAFRVAPVDVRVQGGSADRRIAWALRRLDAVDLDVVVLVRGGGARSDLAPFDSEVVARAVATMHVPVLTGIGHEVDRSVADEVAHSCYKTPTACAAALVQQVDEFAGRLRHAAQRVAARARAGCAVADRSLADVASRTARAAPAALAREARELEHRTRRTADCARRAAGEAAADLEARARAVVVSGPGLLRAEAARLDALVRAVGVAAPRPGRAEDERLAGLEARVRALDPRRVLERGYTVTRDADGRVRTGVAGLGPGDAIVTEFRDGRATSRVDAVTERVEEP